MNELLELLRSAADSCVDTHANGSKWSAVYLPNVSQHYDNGMRFAGLLSALERAGLYRGAGVEDWGMVVMNSAEHEGDCNE